MEECRGGRAVYLRVKSEVKESLRSGVGAKYRATS